MALVDDLTALLDVALEEPAEGRALWSFHVRDRAEPLEVDEIVKLIENGKGVFAIELVYDENLELMQRGAGTKIKNVKDLAALKKRADALGSAGKADLDDAVTAPVPKATVPAAKAARAGPVHGALLGKNLEKKPKR